MAAKLSDLVDKMSGAKLQMDGYADVPTQIVKDPQGAGGRGYFPLPLTILVSGPEVAIQSS